MARLSSLITLAVFYLSSLGEAAPAPAGISLPPGTGPHDVGTIELQLTDYSRPNPFVPHPSSADPRSFMIQLFYPAKNAHQYPLAPYMGPGTAAFNEQSLNLPPGTISLIHPTSHLGAPIKRHAQTHLILFSTGLGTSRHAYTTFAEDLASHGYLVATIDHPYDAGIVEFPDGTLILADPTTDLSDPATFAKLLDVRIQDALFTITRLHSNLTKSIPGVHASLRIRNTGMFGHSLGGATTAGAMYTDPRIRGGINMDGQLDGAVVQCGLSAPFLLMGTPVHNLTTDATWAGLWAGMTAWKRALVLDGALHLTYSDFPAVAALLGGFVDETLLAVFGTIEGARANLVMRVYVRAFFGFVLRGEGDALFAGPDEAYEEVTFQS